MHPAIHIFSFICIISLTLGSLTGCAKKRINVATVSGAPGQEIPLETIDGKSEIPTSGLNFESVDESDLLSQLANSEEAVAAEPSAVATVPSDPIDMAHEPTTLAMEDESLNSPLSDPQPTMEESEFANNNESLPPLSEGQDFSTQSNSSPDDITDDTSATLADLNEDIGAPFPEQRVDLIDSSVSQDSSGELHDPASGEDMEPVPDALQIAKAEPSDSLHNQLDKIQKQEFAAATAGLKDVFFPFDSWTLTEEGKNALKETGRWLKQDFSSVLIIEGHSDQRGTQAYNMILGKRRAIAVRDYLSQLGIDPSHLITISFGKDKPFCLDITEVCHQLNRRGHLLVQNP